MDATLVRPASIRFHPLPSTVESHNRLASWPFGLNGLIAYRVTLSLKDRVICSPRFTSPVSAFAVSASSPALSGVPRRGQSLWSHQLARYARTARESRFDLLEADQGAEVVCREGAKHHDTKGSVEVDERKGAYRRGQIEFHTLNMSPDNVSVH